MSQVRRYAFAIKITLLMALATIIHFRVGVEQLYPLAQGTFSGPFTGVVNTLEFIVPIVIAGIVGVTWLWVLVSPVQEERVVRRRVR